MSEVFTVVSLLWTCSSCRSVNRASLPTVPKSSSLNGKCEKCNLRSLAKWRLVGEDGRPEAPRKASVGAQLGRRPWTDDLS
jgi:hypothetical protein